jgi:uncharacterized membrane protein
VIGLEQIYWIVGAMFAAFAVSQLLDGAWRSALFWGCFAILTAAGSYLPDLFSGVLVIVLAVLGALGLRPKLVTTADFETRERSAAKLGNWLFLPALVIPAIALAGTFLLPTSHLVDIKQVTFIAFALGALVALALASVMLRASPLRAAQEGRRLVDSLGWAAVLPQMLAALGGVFAAAGMGKVVAGLVVDYVPMTAPVIAVVVFTFGMALFTFITGNAFAAFPVMAGGVGLPFIVGKFGGDPVIMSAVGMLSGFCGTLLTPMAANFNIVPAAVLELKDRNAVIKAQAPTALVLLAANTVLMALFVFHR